MLIGIFSIIYIFMITIQAVIPYIVRETIVFGVTVPEQNVCHPKLIAMKKRYTKVISILGIIIFLIMLVLLAIQQWSEIGEAIILMSSIFGVMGISMLIYWLNHQEVMRLKVSEAWGVELKQVRVVDLTARSRDEMLPWPFFAAPISVTIMLIVVTFFQYNQMPHQIAVHWGPSGEADAWTNKTYFTAISLPLVMLMMQFMLWGTVDSMKRSAIRVTANRKEESIESQLKTRKFASWFLMVAIYDLTMLLTTLQFSNIHPSIAKSPVLLPLFLIFTAIIFGSVIILVLKLRKWRLAYAENVKSEIMDVDEDRFWKGGLIYINRQDPSVFVEKRFGVGWTMNLANPRGYIVIFLPLMILLLISIFSL
ncbi:MAG: DUF5808 domain-containing protein [Lysinibacillus sp.]